MQEKQENLPPDDVAYKKIGTTTYEGKFTFVDIFKGAIRRGIESEKLAREEDRYAKTQSKKRRRISEAVPQ